MSLVVLFLINFARQYPHLKGFLLVGLWYLPPVMPLLDSLLRLCIEFLAQLDGCSGTFETGQLYINSMTKALGSNEFFHPPFRVITDYLRNAVSWRHRRAGIFALTKVLSHVREGCQTLRQEHLNSSQEHLSYIAALQ